jgi:hypothetical protein
MNVHFCPSCRSLILAEFRFCPYCGAEAAAKGPGLSEALAQPFERLDRARTPPLGFAQAEESLRRLEADMDLILEQLEREGRLSS